MSKYSALPDLDTAPDVYVSDGPSVDGAERAKQLERLRAEIELLATASETSDEESEDEPASTKLEEPPSNLLDQILSLSHTVERVQPPPECTSCGITLASLSNEVESLTRLVGMGDAQAPPLATTIATLQHQVALLTQPRQLDAVTRRLKTLAPQTEEPGPSPAQTQSEQQDDTPHLASLLRTQSRLEPLLSLPPALLARMRSLASVHEQTAAVHTSLASEGEEVSLLAQRERQIARLLVQLQEAMRANSQVQKGNYNALAQRADRLAARIAALKGDQAPPPLVQEKREADPHDKDEPGEAAAGAAGREVQAAPKADDTTKADGKPEQDHPEPDGELVEA